MNAFTFHCPHCNQKLAGEDSWVGQAVECPTRQQDITVPAPTADAGPRPEAQPKLRLAAAPEADDAGQEEAAVKCPRCRLMAPGDAGFCPACGARLHGVVLTSQPAPEPEKGVIPARLAAALCYPTGCVTGLILFILGDRPFVRFHAAMAILFSPLMVAGQVATGWLFAMAMPSLKMASPGQAPGLGLFHFFIAVRALVLLAGGIVWLLCVISAATGGMFHAPLAGDWADSWLG